MIPKESIDAVEGLPIEQVAEALGIEVSRHWGLCPFHEDRHPSMRFNVGKRSFRCYVCDAWGGAIALTRRVNGLGFVDAVGWLAQTFSLEVETGCQRVFEDVKPRKVKPVRKDEWVFDVGKIAPYVEMPVLTEEARRFLYEERRLKPSVVEWCGISSSKTHLLIPYRDVSGRLVTIQWRYLLKDGRHPRFRFPRGSWCPLYGMQILPHVRPGEELWVMEGCSDCWAMLSTGRKAIAVPSATLLRREDMEPLRGMNLHIFPDQDEAGERLFNRLREVAPGIVRHQLPEGCKDFAEYYLQKGEGVREVTM